MKEDQGQDLKKKEEGSIKEDIEVEAVTEIEIDVVVDHLKIKKKRKIDPKIEKKKRRKNIKRVIDRHQIHEKSD